MHLNIKMGLCMSRCYTEVTRLRRSFHLKTFLHQKVNRRALQSVQKCITLNLQAWRNPNVANCWRLNAGIEDRDRLIDFDMFLDEQPAPRPLSLVSLEKDLVSSDVSLLHDSESEDSDVLYQLGVDNEELELQEETVAAELFREADKIKQIAENSTELINPAKLALDTTARWERIHMNTKEAQEKGETSNGKHLKDQASCSSPSSSVELEWENEDGLSPVTHVPGRDDPSSDTASCLSELSTPVSNGNEELEWDGHFTSTHISQLDVETERLISEIERLTSSALQGAESSDR